MTIVSRLLFLMPSPYRMWNPVSQYLLQPVVISRSPNLGRND
jgi:hypothetical protein